MKKFLALLLAISIVFCLGACKRTKPGEFEQNEITLAQTEIISTFGETEKDTKIVAYENGVNYLKYVISDYAKGTKLSEATHWFYYDVDAFNLFCEELDEEKIIEKKDGIFYVKVKSNLANNSDYEKDLEKLKKKYIVK